MKPFVIASLLLACSASGVAQRSGQSFGVAGMEPLDSVKSGKLTQVWVPSISSCPIGMHARQGSSLQMQRADDGTKQPVMTPSLELMPRDARVIIAANVTVHGHVGAGALPADDLVLRGRQSRKEVNRQLTVRFVPIEPGKVSAQFSLTGLTVIESIELNSVTYADASTWKLAADAGCRVAPDPLLLVSGR